MIKVVFIRINFDTCYRPKILSFNYSSKKMKYELQLKKENEED